MILGLFSMCPLHLLTHTYQLWMSQVILSRSDSQELICKHSQKKKVSKLVNYTSIKQEKVISKKTLDNTINCPSFIHADLQLGQHIQIRDTE